MTVFEFALYRYARTLMTPAELQDAQALAELADRSRSREARAALKAIALDAIRRDVHNTVEREKAPK